MGKKITLDSIRDAAEKKYGSTDIELDNGEELRLLNPLRLPKQKRKELMKLQDRLNEAAKIAENEESEEEPEDQEELLKEAILLVSHSQKLAKQFLSDVGGDMAVLAEAFSSYTGETEMGEASASES